MNLIFQIQKNFNKNLEINNNLDYSNSNLLLLNNSYFTNNEQAINPLELDNMKPNS